MNIIINFQGVTDMRLLTLNFASKKIRRIKGSEA